MDSRLTIRIAIGIWLIGPASASLAAEHPGLPLYRTQCASCHGEDGQGAADGYDEPLFGDHSIKALARYIEKSMPEDDPESCVGDDADQVASYIHDAFYSHEARQREGFIPPSRVELARLTVSQYRNVVADLIQHFTPETTPEKPRGQKRREKGDGEAIAGDRQKGSGDRSGPSDRGILGEYFQSDGMSKANAEKFKRLDRRIDFDFGTDSPSEEITNDQFAIIWQGSIEADTTGYYEFRLRTQNGARLYLNRDTIERRRRLRDDSSVSGQSALIDEWVGSGKMRQRTARVFLLGGRRYPLRLEFFKYKDKDASIRLEWKPPNSSWSVIDHRHLRSALASRTYVVDTPFPPDDRSLGYERGSSVSRQWHVATSNAAIATANEVVARLPVLAGINEKTPDREAKLKDFIIRFAEVAFRRPMSESEATVFRSAPFEDAPNLETATRRAILMVLDSPRFLYTDLTPPDEVPSQHAVAARLALAMWDSIPDKPLAKAADDGKLATADQVNEQARRMLCDPKARYKIRRFFRDWLEFEERDLSKDKEAFPSFDEAVIADLRYSLEAFLDDIVWSEASDYRQLLLSDRLVLNQRLQELYLGDRSDDSKQKRPNQDSPEQTSPDQDSTVQNKATQNIAEPSTPDSEATTAIASGSDSDANQDDASDFVSIEFPNQSRAGVLTHPYLLSAFAYYNSTSPIHRGVFLTRNIVGRELRPPPVDVAFENDAFDPSLTMREKVTELTRDAACISCHSVINPLGFTLENFDAIGRWRTADGNKPIQTEGEYTSRDGETITIRNARDVANLAVASESAHQAFVAQLFHHLIMQDPAAYGPNRLKMLRLAFTQDDYNIQGLMVRIATTAALHGTTSDNAGVGGRLPDDPAAEGATAQRSETIDGPKTKTANPSP